MTATTLRQSELINCKIRDVFSRKKRGDSEGKAKGEHAGHITFL
jgi:hypothetical protein